MGVVLGCTRICLAVLGCTRFYLAVLGCTRLFLAVPGLVWSVLKGLKMFGTINPTCLWMGWDWMGYLQTGPFLDHLAVIKTSSKTTETHCIQKRDQSPQNWDVISHT